MMHRPARLRRRAVAPSDGFTLVEMTLVTALLGIISAVAIPLMGRAQHAALEASTIGSLRAIHGAQVTYAETCGGSYYAPSIVWLARPPRPGQAGFISPEFTANTTDRYVYRIRFSSGPTAATAPATCNGLRAGRAVPSYFVGADSIQGGNRSPYRHFGVNASGAIYESTRRIGVTLTGPPPPPARPVK